MSGTQDTVISRNQRDPQQARSAGRSLCAAAFLAVAEEEYGRQIPFAFLERIQAEWKEKFADKALTATAHSLDKTFGCVRPPQPALQNPLHYALHPGGPVTPGPLRRGAARSELPTNLHPPLRHWHRFERDPCCFYIAGTRAVHSSATDAAWRVSSAPKWGR